MTISVRIVNIDHYLAKPGPLDRSYSPFSKKLTKVPMIRIFGSTFAGQKVCLHVHQVYPYFFIPYKIPPEYTTEQEIQKDIFQFGNSLNEAMNLAKPNVEKDQHIVAIVLTKGTPFYGYHVGYETFLKIYMVNPYEKQQMLDLLQSEAIMGVRFQPYEAHLNFELQFLMDFNLFGMDWLHIDEKQPIFPAVFRLPLQEEPKSSYPISQASSTIASSNNDSPTNDEKYHVYTSKTIPVHLQSDLVPRESYCELELDITGMSILNRLDLEERPIHSTLNLERNVQKEALSNPEEEARKKLVKSLETIWKDEASRRKYRNIWDPIPPVAQTEEREPHKSWISETSLRRLMEKMLTGHKFDEKSESQENSGLVANVSTIFQAIEALYPEEYQLWKQERIKKKSPVESPASKKSEEKIDSSSEEWPPSVLETIHRSVTPPPSSQQRSHFHIAATPSRYKVWETPTQLDRSIIDTLIRDPSFDEDQESQAGEEGEDNQADDVYFSMGENITENDIAKRMQQAEKREKFPTTEINYEEQLRPRKLDFFTESEKIDNILRKQPQTQNLSKMILDDIYEGENEEDRDIQDVPIEFSNIPPNPLRMPRQWRNRKRNIDQLDGSKDNKNDRKVKRKLTAEEKWEAEKNVFKKVRMHLKRSTTPNSPQSNQVSRDRTPPQQDTSEIKIPSKQDKQVAPLKYSLTGEKLSERLRSKIEKMEKAFPKNMASEEERSRKIAKQPIVKRARQPLVRKASLSQPVKKQTVSTEKADVSKSQQQLERSDSIQVVESARSKIPRVVIESFDPNSPINQLPAMELPQAFTSINYQEDAPKVDYIQALTSNIDVTNHSRKVPLALTDINSQDNASEADYIQAVASSVNDAFNQSRIRELLQASPGNDSQNKASAFSVHDTAKSLSITELQQAFTHNDSQENATPLFVPSSQSSDTQILIYAHEPPKILSKDVPKKPVIYKEPFYSKESDLPRYPTVFAGKEFKLPISGVHALKEFKSVYDIECTDKKTLSTYIRIRHWTPCTDPPSYKEVVEWANNNKSQKAVRKNSTTQLDKPTAENTYRFKASITKPQAKSKRIRDHVDYFSLEIHVNTRELLLPDPQKDPVQAIFYCLQTEDKRILSNGYQEGYFVGIIALREFDISKAGLSNTRAIIDYADDEEQLLTILIEKIRYYDPDILVGYEVQNSSWGYLVERGVEIGLHMLDELSRINLQTDTIRRDQWGFQKTSVYKTIGRHILNVWRLMKSEIALTSYTFENIAYHFLHDRVPHYSHETLTSWYTKGAAVLKYRLFKYYLKRVQMNLDLLDASQVVTRTCESARVFGIDFYAVLSRGSQYKVESIMFRIAKPENYVLLTPNRRQVASQRSLEILPLIMEPVSQFYSSPMVVLDFQSLYPSIMIAYNICFSTCLGRVRGLDESSKFGVLDSFDLPDGLLDSLKDYVNISPNGIMFVKPEIRKSTLAKMLAELLDTRVMIKRAMKDYKEDTGLSRMLDAKQLTLKLLANVTYGYTSASFSGRMPSVEIADSIVAAGRETLERSIRLINETEKWGARVSYGDTDSVFVYFPGKTKDEAFTLGNEIAETITKLNPAPVKLKFEKVYHPAVLLAKKRYVGFKYENPGDTEPVFEAKGIETVRRDGTAATQNILESCLKILFRTQDMSELKEFLHRQWTKILSNRVLLQEFIIAKEVKMGTYSSRGGPNGALIAQARMDEDARAEPQYGERVPYVVVYRGGPKARLKDRVVRPEELLADSSLRLDAEYYIRKQIIPPLSRIFNLMGVDIESWYDSMPRSMKTEALAVAQSNQNQTKRITRIDQYYARSHCIICRKVTDQNVCEGCQATPQDTILTLMSRQQQTQHKFRNILQICQNCSSLSPLDAMTITNEVEQYADIPCDSLDCPVFYERHRAKQDVAATSNYDAIIEELF